MQLWNRSRQCTICSFRINLQQSATSATSRSYHPSPFLFRDRAAERQSRKNKKGDYVIKRRGPQSAGGTSRQNDKRKPFGGGGGASRSTGKVFQQRDFLELNVRARLNAVRELLRKERMTPSQEKSQLDGLDPDGSLWTAFVLSVEDAVAIAQKEEKVDSGRAGSLAQKLLTANQGAQWREEMDKTLQFAFYDLTVSDPFSRDVTSALPELDLRYPTEWYPGARMLQREIHLHVGPTNSGKTYTALKRLEQSQNGYYAGPLRLLAHEVYSRFNDRGIPCDLVTGDDVRFNDSATQVKMYSSTVEMVDIGRDCEVGVVDEIQMIASDDRGWAWTRAVLGSRAKELHLCGEARVVPLIRTLAASMGDTLHVHEYERLNPLKVTSRSLRGNLNNLRKGDCVVSFSIMGIHALKKQIEIDTGRRAAVVYGSLPPETRAQQAALFNDPDNDYDYLVASDAVGMGLNLSIKRVVFETTMKYNGRFHDRLSIPQMKQIAGRAGRYRTSQDDKKGTSSTAVDKPSTNPSQQPKNTGNVGLVTCLDEADLPILRHALQSEPSPIRYAGVLPHGDLYTDFAARLPYNTPFEYIIGRVCELAITQPRYKICDIREQLQIARVLDRIPNMKLRDRIVFAAAPASFSRGNSGADCTQVLEALGQVVADNASKNVADIMEIQLEILDLPISPQRTYLESLESLHKALILYLWLSYRFTFNFIDQDMAIRAKQLCEEKINLTLLSFSANPKLRQRLLDLKRKSGNAASDNQALLERSGVADENLDGSDQEGLEGIEGALDAIKKGGRPRSEDAATDEGLENDTGVTFDWGSQAGETEVTPLEGKIIEEESEQRRGAAASS